MAEVAEVVEMAEVAKMADVAEWLAICIRETIRPTDNKISFSMEPAVCALLKEQQNCCCQSLG